MLIFTEQMLDAMRQHSIPSQYLCQAKNDLYSFYPNRCTVMGPKHFDCFVEYGVNKAWKYGYRSSVGMRNILILMLHLGSDFDIDPFFPWADLEFDKQSIEAEQKHLTTLWDAFTLYFSATLGGDLTCLKMAILRFKQTPFERYASAHTIEQILELMSQIYPERTESLTKSDWHYIIEEHARNTLAKCNMEYTKGARSLLVCLYSIWGTGFYKDSIHHHFEASTRREKVSRTPEETCRLLHSTASSYADTVISLINDEKWLS